MKNTPKHIGNRAPDATRHLNGTCAALRTQGFTVPENFHTHMDYLRTRNSPFTNINEDC